MSTTTPIATLNDDQIDVALERADNLVAEAQEWRDKLIEERRRRKSVVVAEGIQSAIRHAFTGGREGKPLPRVRPGTTIVDALMSAAREMSPAATYAQQRNNDRHLSRSHDAALSRAAEGRY